MSARHCSRENCRGGRGATRFSTSKDYLQNPARTYFILHRFLPSGACTLSTADSVGGVACMACRPHSRVQRSHGGRIVQCLIAGDQSL